MVRRQIKYKHTGKPFINYISGFLCKRFLGVKIGIINLAFLHPPLILAVLLDYVFVGNVVNPFILAIIKFNAIGGQPHQ